MARANTCFTEASVVNIVWFFILLREMKVLDASEKWSETIIGFFVPVSPSVQPHRTNRFPHWRDFHEIRYLSIFLKSADKIQGSIKYDKYNRRFT
jgi:hypothetical protein